MSRIRTESALGAAVASVAVLSAAGALQQSFRLPVQAFTSTLNESGPMPAANPYTSDARINAKYVSADFVPDGNLSDVVWKNAQWVSFSHDMSGSPSFPESATRVSAAWSNTYVYFAFECKYSTLNVYEGEDAATERWELWLRDVAEVFLNPQPERVNHYYEFEVSPNNQWIDLEIDKGRTPFNNAWWDSGFEHATHIDRTNLTWTCEMRIPLAPMKAAAITPGTEWRVNFFRADGEGPEDHRRFMSWSTIPSGRSFHAPERFGAIKFTKP